MSNSGEAIAPPPGADEVMPEGVENDADSILLIPVDTPSEQIEDSVWDNEFDVLFHRLRALDRQIEATIKYGTSQEVRAHVRQTVSKVSPEVNGTTAFTTMAWVTPVPVAPVLTLGAYGASLVAGGVRAHRTGMANIDPEDYEPIDIGNKAQILTQLDRDGDGVEGSEPSPVLQFIPPQSATKPSREFMRWQLRHIQSVFDASEMVGRIRPKIALPMDYVEAMDPQDREVATVTDTSSFWPTEIQNYKIVSKPQEVGLFDLADFLERPATDYEGEFQNHFPLLLERFMQLFPRNADLAALLNNATTDYESQRSAKMRLRTMLARHFERTEDPVVFWAQAEDGLKQRDRYYPDVRITNGGPLKKITLQPNGFVETSKPLSDVLNATGLLEVSDELLAEEPKDSQAPLVMYLLHEMMDKHGQHLVRHSKGSDDAEVEEVNFDAQGYAQLEFMKHGGNPIEIKYVRPPYSRIKATARAGAVALTLSGVSLLNHATGASGYATDALRSIFSSPSDTTHEGGNSLPPLLAPSTAASAGELTPTISKPEHDVPIWRVEDQGIPTAGYYGQHVFEYQIDGTWVDEDVRSYELQDPTPVVLPEYSDTFSEPHIKVTTALIIGDEGSSIMLPVRNQTEIAALSLSGSSGPLPYFVERFADNTIQLTFLGPEEGPQLIDVTYALVESGENQLQANHAPGAFTYDAEEDQFILQEIDQSIWSSGELAVEDLDVRTIGEEMRRSLQYLDHNPELGERLIDAESPNEFLQIVKDEQVCDCDVCASVIGLLAAAKGEEIQVAAGFLNVPGHNGSEGSASFLSSGESHGWNVDSDGEVIDFTPSALAQPLREYASSDEEIDVQQQQWEERLRRLESQALAELDEYLEARERERSENILKNGVFAILALASTLTIAKAGRDYRREKYREYLEETNFHDAHRLLEKLQFGPPSDGPVTIKKSDVITDVDYIEKVREQISPLLLKEFLDDPKKLADGDRELIKRTRILAKESLKEAT